MITSLMLDGTGMQACGLFENDAGKMVQVGIEGRLGSVVFRGTYGHAPPVYLRGASHSRDGVSNKPLSQCRL
jgi:hypothetical protein